MNRQTLKEGRWHRLVEKKIGRRSLLKGVAAASTVAAATISASPLNLQTQLAHAAALDRPDSAALQNPHLLFQPIGPSTEDDVILPEGYDYTIVAQWGQYIGKGNSTVGFNHDWTGFFPLDWQDSYIDPDNVHKGFLSHHMSSDEGILVINHEYVNPLFVGHYDPMSNAPKSAEQLYVEQENVGLTIIRVKRNGDGRWDMVKDGQENRRITAHTPMILTGPAAHIDGGPAVIGTLANCSGGMTPWGTALSCEENFQYFPAQGRLGLNWAPEIYGKRHYGWVVEVDPFDPQSTPRKHTAMGRFRHENVAIQVAKDGTIVAYMGDDRADSCVYKFIADQKLIDPADQEANKHILESGTLYVADFASGVWILLDYDQQKALHNLTDDDGHLLFESQIDVLADVRTAAMFLGGTPVDRPEDIEINPVDKNIFIALANNTDHGNFHGQIVRLVEEEPTSLSFEWSIFAYGGPQSGFSSPDNMIFDDEGNLWVVTDISTRGPALNTYKFQGNNGLFFFRTSGPHAGIAYQFASTPIDSEMTGLSWTPDGQTLFASIQHPGERSRSREEPTSNWPSGGRAIPRPATIAITGFPGRG